MDLRQLRYFSVLAAQQHFGRAADVLHIAQPALTRQIRQLEEELGVELFERHPRGASLTESGAFLLGRVQFLLNYAEQVKEDMTTFQREPSGVVTIGLSPGISSMLAVPLTLQLKSRHPSIRIRMVEDFAPSLQGMLLRGGVDIAVLNGSVRTADLAMEPLMREQMCLIGPATHPRMKQASIRVDQLAGIPLVLTGLAKSGLRLELEAMAARTGTVLEAQAEVESLDVARRLVLAGIGLTVHFAAVAAEDISKGTLAAVPIESLYLDRMLARATGRPVSRAADAATRVLKEVVVREVAQGRWPHASLASA